MLKIMAMVVLGLAGSVAGAETLYRWVDDRGTVQFGQNPPANRPFAEVRVRAAQPPGGQIRTPDAPAATNTDPEEPAPQVATPAPMPPAERQQRCAQARKDAETLETNPRLARTLPNGERERIGEDERQALIRQTQEELRQYCD